MGGEPGGGVGVLTGRAAGDVVLAEDGYACTPGNRVAQQFKPGGFGKFDGALQTRVIFMVA